MRKDRKYMLGGVASMLLRRLNSFFGYTEELDSPQISSDAQNLKSIFEEIYKETIVPLFKERGFRRKGQNFIRVTNDITQAANLQKSRWNHSESVRFTFNIGIYNENINKVSYNTEKSIEFPNVTDCFFQDRLGTYTHKKDFWHEITPKTDISKLKNDLSHDLQLLFQLFEDYTSLESMKSFIDNERQISPSTKIIFFMETGQKERALQLLNTLIPKSTSGTIIFPNGSSQTTNSEPKLNQYYIDRLKDLATYYSFDQNAH
ncbi:MAG: hypothetical protein DI539_10515 [Flavobacterium psychrophilum]|nr:MAG: hypothetical protein DI539_10515 [Flavobacterium psychrophilum]